MQKTIAIFSALFAAHCSCSSAQGGTLTKLQVLKIARRDAEEICRAGPYLEKYRIAGCVYVATFVDGAWNVRIRPDLRDGKGDPIKFMGGDTLYIYSSTGKLLQILPGM